MLILCIIYKYLIYIYKIWQLHVGRCPILLPHFSHEDAVRQILAEMKALYEQNQKDVQSISEGEYKMYSCIHLRHAALERDKRCLLVYLYSRLKNIRELRWAFGSILPVDIKLNLTEPEVKWFTSYSKSLANYMRNIGENYSLSLTQDISPPKSLFIQVRCLTDYGEYETDDGTVIHMNRNTTHFLQRSQCEHLIRQGILQHIIS
ncbi:DNA replication complex GINS protein PSF1 [Nymphon striatum]|nr:DNA replication complex GINS protein PSF1 [Nymphon striatum]